MTESEIDWLEAVWEIPSIRAKNKYGSDVPLSTYVQGILKDWLPKIQSEAGYLFTSNGDKPFSGFSKAKKRLDAKMLALARKEAEQSGEDPRKIAFAPWRLHDLRRTTTTGMAKLGIPVHVSEGVLNHKSGTISGVVAIYNRYEYLDEKRAALERWGDHVMKLIGHCPADDKIVSAPNGTPAPLEPWLASIVENLQN